MRRITLLFSLLMFILAACGGGEKSPPVDKKTLFGKIDGNSYKNSFFNIQVTVPDDWQVLANKFQTRLGATLFEAELREEGDAFPTATYTIEMEKANPFKKPSVMEELESSKEGLSFLYGAENCEFEPFKKVKLGSEEFVMLRCTVNDEGVMYFDEYMRIENGYILDIVVGYPGGAEDIGEMFIEATKSVK